MTCSRCGSERLYQFEASPSVRVQPPTLPLVCRSCGLITIGGEPVRLPEALETQARDMAEAAATTGKETAEAIADDPNVRVEKYFENVYRKAYLDGFFRALAFYNHVAKEGRLVRMRELWRAARVDIPRGSSDVVVHIDADLYTEFEQLLHLGAAPEIINATSPSHARPPVPEGSA